VLDYSVGLEVGLFVPIVGEIEGDGVISVGLVVGELVGFGKHVMSPKSPIFVNTFA